jgi:Fic family protein
MNRGLQGVERIQRIPDESFRAFLPHPLPPDPPLLLNSQLSDRLEQANRAIGRLDGLALLLPDLSLFLYYYVRKEAILSSQIEGTQSSLSDLLLFESQELPGVPLDDVQEVSNYVAALTYGWEQVKAGQPLTLRLMREIHSVLLSKGRGQEMSPGEFRRSQNWIGGSRPGNAAFVPPPPGEVMNCMGALETFLHDRPERTPTLIKAALMHVQFETIHPFLDGNGRLGRLLIPLLLCYEKALERPLLYLSLYFKTHRSAYYDHLQRVRIDGNWEAWLDFFLEGVALMADQATQTAQRIFQLSNANRQRVENLGRSALSPLRLYQWILTKPMFTMNEAASSLGMTFPTVSRSVYHLRQLNIIEEISGRERGQVFVYEALLRILGEGTGEPL